MDYHPFSVPNIVVLSILVTILTGCVQPEFLRPRPDMSRDSDEYNERSSSERPDISPRRTPDPEEGALSLARCMKLAMHNSPRARREWQNARAASARAGQTWGQLLPQIDFDYNAVRSKTQELSYVDVDYLRTTYDARFGLRQLLFDGGKTRYELSAAEAELRSADFRHNSTLQEVALSTQKAYYELLTSKALLDVAEETVEQRRRHVRLAERQAEAGRAREVEVLQAKARLSEAEFDRVDARNQVRQTRGRLNVIMGLPPNHPLEIKEMPDKVTEEEVEDVEKLMDLASEQRPSLKSAAEQVERWRDLVHAEKRRRLPNINTDLSYGWKDTKAVPEREEYSMSAGLNLPLFTGFQTTYGIRNAKARLQSAIREYEENLRQVEQEVWDAFSEVVRAKESVKVAESYVKSTRESQKVAERGYEEGRATIVELIDAQTELTQALARQHRSRLQWYSSIAALERAVGEILSEQQNSE